MYYDKKIKYLNYMEQGEKIRGCGFLKAEVRDESLNLEININGLPGENSGSRDIILQFPKSEQTIGKILLKEGRGQFKVQYNHMNNIFESGDYEAWQGLRIMLEEGREVCGFWGDEARGMAVATTTGNVSDQRDKLIDAASDIADTSETDGAGMIQTVVHKADEKSMPEKMEREEVGRETVTIGGGDVRIAERNQQGEEKPSRPSQQVSRSRPGMSLMEEKWQQLCEIYPHINPFRDEREYLSLSPADFVLLSANSYKKANNSFLLHGFYNYKHLLLARIERKGEIMYYVGAPGNYFEREKQVAILFGFDSFECAVEPAQAGDFGYYMMRVEI